MKPVTDYIGNEIKEGDEICIITVIDRELFHYGGMLVPGKGFIENPEPLRPDSPCWIVGNYTKVLKSVTGNLFTEYISDSCNFRQSIELYHVFMQTSQILAIKGKSDNIQSYLTYKKNNS